jgi:hypothetical protein
MNKEIILQEIDSLNRTLDFVQEEQSFIKRKLSSYLENVVLNEALLWAESLHQEILNRETAIQLLKSDIIKLASLVISKRSVNNIVDAGIVENFRKYKQQLAYLETEFLSWKHTTNEKFESPSS